MTVKELKAKLEILERNNLGDIDVYCGVLGDSDNVMTVSTVEIANHLPVILLTGYSMEGEQICSMDCHSFCTDECIHSGDCSNDDRDSFCALLNVDGREEIDEEWDRKTTQERLEEGERLIQMEIERNR